MKLQQAIPFPIFDVAKPLDRHGFASRCIHQRLGKRTRASTRIFDVAGDNEQVGRAAREAINRRRENHVALRQLAS